MRVFLAGGALVALLFFAAASASAEGETEAAGAGEAVTPEPAATLETPEAVVPETEVTPATPAEAPAEAAQPAAGEAVNSSGDDASRLALDETLKTLETELAEQNETLASAKTDVERSMIQNHIHRLEREINSLRALKP